MALSRRDFLAASGGIGLGIAGAGFLAGSASNSFGWQNLPSERRYFRSLSPHRYYVSQFNRPIKGTGKGQRALLTHAYDELGIPWENQLQTHGTCVGFGASKGVQLLDAIDCIKNGGAFGGLQAVEVNYAGSRVQIGGGKIRGDGSTGIWMARWLMEFGSIIRDNYGQHDLTTHSPRRARAWGKAGVPDTLLPECREHPVQTALNVDGGYDQAIDLMANGYPIMVCSGIGFSPQMDSAGFLNPAEQWQHCMTAIGFDDASRRPGVCILNHWPMNFYQNWKEHDLGTPEGAFWVDKRVFNQMLGYGDSYALSNYTSYREDPLDFILF